MSRSTYKKLFEGVQRRKIHLFLLLDCSSSMNGQPLSSLNSAISNLLGDLPSKLAKINVDVILHALTYSSTVNWYIKNQNIRDNSEWVYIEKARGFTKMGEAIKTFTDYFLEVTQNESALFRPISILFADGTSTDDYLKGLNYMEKSGISKQCIRASVAIGDKCNEVALNKFCSDDITVMNARNSEEIGMITNLITSQAIEMSSSLEDKRIYTKSKDDISLIESLNGVINEKY